MYEPVLRVESPGHVARTSWLRDLELNVRGASLWHIECATAAGIDAPQPPAPAA